MPNHTTISTDMPGGNAHVLACRDDGDTTGVRFMPEPVGSPEAMWFRFQITPAEPATGRSSGTKPRRLIQCQLELPDNLLGGSRSAEGFLPVFKTEHRDWQRVAQVSVTEREDGRPIHIWDVPADEGRVEVALCYPYGQDELRALTDAGHWREDIIGLTDGGRTLARLSNGVGAMREAGEAEASRPGLYCIAQQHAGETPGAWVLDGFLRAIAAAGERAPLVWAVPLVDLDGVVEGRFGKDSFPWDFNRSWGSKRYPEALRPDMGTHPMRHEVRCIQTDMTHWCKRCAPTLALDFHAPVMRESRGVFCYVRDVDANHQPDAEHRPWVESVQQAVGSELSRDPFAMSIRYPARWNTARASDFATEALGVPHLLIEVPYAIARQTPLTREGYQDMGRRIAEALIARIEAHASTSPTRQ